MRQLDLNKTVTEEKKIPKEQQQVQSEEEILKEQQAMEEAAKLKEQQALEQEEQKLKAEGKTRVAYETEATHDGQTPQGALYISIINAEKEEAIVNNKALKPGEEKIYPFVGKGYREITYITNGTTLRILCIL